MAKSNQRTVVFLQDFATKKAGEDFKCDGMLARTLIDKKVAQYKSDVQKEEQPVQKTAKTKKKQ